mmetsp:Transcript_27393/g.54815  ORF Transcript_27393/g.54815 Transcript_27393/m.54815 type:complete len:396 (+) Transcript_27393:566-1753(+)
MVQADGPHRIGPGRLVSRRRGWRRRQRHRHLPGAGLGIRRHPGGPRRQVSGDAAADEKGRAGLRRRPRSAEPPPGGGLRLRLRESQRDPDGRGAPAKPRRLRRGPGRAGRRPGGAGRRPRHRHVLPARGRVFRPRRHHGPHAGAVAVPAAHHQRRGHSRTPEPPEELVRHHGCVRSLRRPGGRRRIQLDGDRLDVLSVFWRRGGPAEGRRRHRPGGRRRRKIRERVRVEQHRGRPPTGGGARGRRQAALQPRSGGGRLPPGGTPLATAHPPRERYGHGRCAPAARGLGVAGNCCTVPVGVGRRRDGSARRVRRGCDRAGSPGPPDRLEAIVRAAGHGGTVRRPAAKDPVLGRGRSARGQRGGRRGEHGRNTRSRRCVRAEPTRPTLVREKRSLNN